ncbi:LCCL domain-containing protein [Lutibacter sp.]|uniref:LCCL domain-containing protein n=1 Tax=Lutibacter sp. TaxID=1925666 RepID=UPI002735C6BF|nr:LCCL domain-containing protein [Lutibacter sp.]MDP3313758.1 LCCL domain-containing protein [Lutibacter sp.]
MKKGKVICVFFLLLFLSNGIYAQILNDLVNLVPYRTNKGLTYSVNVTGTNQGSVWGGSNGIYTDDSTIGKAAVHAGLLKVGEVGVLKVTILAGQPSYTGSAKNGISTHSFGSFGGSFRFENVVVRAEETNSSEVLNSPVNLATYRKNQGTTYSIKVTGTNQGSVWGGSNGIYTDDSTIGKAAVHAGLLKEGEVGVLKVTILAGQSSFTGSTKNGISTQSFGSFGGSFRFDSQAKIDDNQNPSQPTKTANALSVLNKIANTIQNPTQPRVETTKPENKNKSENSNNAQVSKKTDTNNKQNNSKVETESQTKKPTTVTQTINLEAMTDIPPSKPLPFLDITTLSKTEWDGAVSAAMEGMRLVYGPMTDVDNKQFEKSWAPLRQTPFKEAVDYLNKFNPLLGEFLTYRTSITQTSILMEQAVQNAGYAAEYDDPQSSLAYFDLAKKYQILLISRQKRLQQITKDLIALGNPPDGAQMMAEQQRKYKQEKDYLKSLTNKNIKNEFERAGCWAGYEHLQGGGGNIILYDPIFSYIYKVVLENGKETYYSLKICSNCKRFNGNYSANVIEHLHIGEIIVNLESNKFVKPFAITGNSLSDGKNHSVLMQFEYPNIPHFQETSNENFNQQIKNDKMNRSSNNDNSHPWWQLELEKKIEINSLANAFYNTALKWTENGKWQQFKHTISVPDELVIEFSNEMMSDGVGKITQTQSKPNISATKTQTETITDNSNSGENHLHIFDDKKPEDRRKIDAEAIEFHNTNLAIIQKNMARDQQDLANEKDPQRRKDYEMRILGAQANIQAENDRIATIQTGVIVFNRSPWDDYAKSNFIQNISENQQKMENISRGVRKAYEQADRLPDEEARKVREIINTKYNGKIMANLDEKAAKAIIEEANSVGKKYYQGKIDVALANNKDALAEAAWADACLQTAEIVKTTADYSMMGLSMFGGQYVNNAYQGITGYIDGGPKEAFLRVAGSYNTITGVAVDGFRGFEDAVNKGGDFVDGFMGAGWEAAKGLITEKAMAFGVGKISGSFNRPNGDLPHIDGPSKTGQSAGNPSAIPRKVPRVGEPDFNRPLTAQEIAINREQIADGRIKVNSYKNTFEKLETARKAGAPPSEIKKILIELDDRSAKIHSSPQAKMMMKTMQKQPKNLDMIKRYSNSMDRIHQKVEKRYQAEMQKNGWSPEELQAIRNKPDPADLQRAQEMKARGETVQPEALLGSKTVNMDYDAGRNPKIGADGKPVPPMKNGKPVPVEAWHKEAQDAWDRAYEAETGQNAEKSWENITHGKIPDAYADLNVLQKNGILQANKQWAGQTADVTYYKAEHLRGTPEFQRVEKYVEIARGTSKDYRTKMEPLFNQKRPQAGTPSFEAWQKHKNYWDKVNGVLNDMGSGKKDPMTADREIRQLSGGKSVLEVTFDMRNFMESLLLLGNN